MFELSMHTYPALLRLPCTVKARSACPENRDSTHTCSLSQAAPYCGCLGCPDAHHSCCQGGLPSRHQMHICHSCLKLPCTWAARSPAKAADNRACQIQVKQAHLPLVPQAVLHRGQQGCCGALALGCVLARAALQARSIQCLLLIHLPGCLRQLLWHPAPDSQQQSVSGSFSHLRLAYAVLTLVAMSYC